MQLNIYCMKCLYEKVLTKQRYVINDELLIDLECENGHKIFQNIAQYKYEVLFE